MAMQFPVTVKCRGEVFVAYSPEMLENIVKLINTDTSAAREVLRRYRALPDAVVSRGSQSADAARAD